MRSPRHIVLLIPLSFSLVLLAGCGGNSTTSTLNQPPPPPAVEPNNCKATHTTSPAQAAPTANVAGPAFSGVVKAGQQPVAGALVQLYVAGNTGNGSASTALFTTPISTDAAGLFPISTSFVCPYSNSLLYAVARGGAVGGSSNNSIVLAAVLGPCGSIPNGAAFTLNEATTVAAAYAMSQFIAPVSGGASAEDIGATPTNSSGLLLAAATAANLVDPATGTAPGASFPSMGTAPVAKINTLANLLNACNVSGASSSACTNLYDESSTAGTPADTFAAVIGIVQHPGANTSALYTLSRASAAYSPSLAAAPPDWTLAVIYKGGGMNGPSSVSIDSIGRVWVANYFSVASLFTNLGAPVFSSGVAGYPLEESFGGAVDADDKLWITNEQSDGVLNGGLGSISVFDKTGVPYANYSSGGINFPLSVAFDTSGVAWVVDYGDSSVTLLDDVGNPLSGTAGYSAANLVFPVAVATDAKCNAYVANQSSKTLTRVLADGSAFTDFTVGEGPSGIAIDDAGNVWSANYYGDSIGLISASSSEVVSGPGYTGGGIDHPQGIAADGSGTVWVVNYRGPALSELAGATTAMPGQILSPPAGWAPDAKLGEAFGLAIDASGNLWATSFATNTLTEYVGLASPVQTPQLGPVRIP